MLMPADWKMQGKTGKFRKSSPKSLKVTSTLCRGFWMQVSVSPSESSKLSALLYYQDTFFYLKSEWLIHDSFPLFPDSIILARWLLYWQWQTMEDFNCVGISMCLMQRRIWSQQYATHSHMPCNALSVGIFCRLFYTHQMYVNLHYSK